MRFDFHYTREGWRISEVNSDVPGGYNEASGFATLVAEHYADALPTGDPAGALADAIASRTPQGGAVALVHATAFSDDRQVMTYLGKRLQARGLTPLFVAPDHVVWRRGHALVECGWHAGPVDLVLRFFPAEWLPNLPRSSRWRHFFAGSTIPITNPGAALLTQSKRFPLAWKYLDADLPTWRRLLPETCDPRDVNAASPAWVLKPALGRVGDGVGVHGVTEPREWRAIQEDAARHPGEWVAQRRFDAIPASIDGKSYYPCIGVYTVDGQPAGAYGRLAETPLIDHRACDVAILVGTKQGVAHGAMGSL